MIEGEMPFLTLLPATYSRQESCLWGHENRRGATPCLGSTIELILDVRVSGELALKACMGIEEPALTLFF